MASDRGSSKFRLAVPRRLTDRRGADMPDELNNTKIIELTPDMEIGPAVVPTAADFYDFIERGDTRGLERAYTAQRVTELHQEPPRRFGFLESVFGGPTGAAGVARDVMRGILEIRRQATENVRAENALSAERIMKANTQVNFDLERSKLEAEISDQYLRKAEADVATQEVLEEAAVRRAERAARAAHYRLERVRAEEAAKDEVMRRDDREERLRRMAASYQQRASEIAAANEALTTYADGLEDGIHRRDAELNQREQEIKRLQEELRRQGDEHQKSERQQEELRQAEKNDDDRRQARERKRFQHEYEMEALKTKRQQERHQQQVDRAKLKRRLAGASDPDAARVRRGQIDQDRALQKITDELRAFTDHAERVTYARREVDAYLKRVAEQYGEDSDEYNTALAQADIFTRKLQDEQGEV